MARVSPHSRCPCFRVLNQIINNYCCWPHQFPIRNPTSTNPSYITQITHSQMTTHQASHVGSSGEHPLELVLGDCAVPVAAVGLVEHELELVVAHGLAQVEGDLLEVGEGDEFPVLEGEQLEGPLDLLLRLLLVHLRSHDLQELLVVDVVGVLLVLLVGAQVRNQPLDLVLLGLEAQGPQRHLQLLDVDHPRAVGVEEVEGLLDVLLLLLGQLLSEDLLGLGLLGVLVGLCVVVHGTLDSNYTSVCYILAQLIEQRGVVSTE